MRVFGNYFANRMLIVETDKDTQTAKVKSGVPQGSVIGPQLWNIMYNLRVPEEASINGFADDIAIKVQARHLE